MPFARRFAAFHWEGERPKQAVNGYRYYFEGRGLGFGPFFFFFCCVFLGEGGRFFVGFCGLFFGKGPALGGESGGVLWFAGWGKKTLRSVFLLEDSTKKKGRFGTVGRRCNDNDVFSFAVGFFLELLHFVKWKVW